MSSLGTLCLRRRHKIPKLELPVQKLFQTQASHQKPQPTRPSSPAGSSSLRLLAVRWFPVMLNEDLLRFATFTFSLSSKSGKFSCWSLGLDRWLPSHPPVEVELVSSLPLEGGWGRHPMCHFRELQRATTNLVHLSASRPESFFFCHSKLSVAAVFAWVT